MKRRLRILALVALAEAVVLLGWAWWMERRICRMAEVLDA